MPRKITTVLLALLALAVGLLLLLDLAYLFHGSLEMFPGSEQEDKVTLVTAVVALSLGLVEAILFFLIWRLRRTNRS